MLIIAQMPFFWKNSLANSPMVPKPATELNPNINVGHFFPLQHSSIWWKSSLESRGGNPSNTFTWEITFFFLNKLLINKSILLTMCPAENEGGFLKMYHIVLWGREKMIIRAAQWHIFMRFLVINSFLLCPPTTTTFTPKHSVHVNSVHQSAKHCAWCLL